MESSRSNIIAGINAALGIILWFGYVYAKHQLQRGG